MKLKSIFLVIAFILFTLLISQESSFAYSGLDSCPLFKGNIEDSRLQGWVGTLRNAYKSIRQTEDCQNIGSPLENLRDKNPDQLNKILNPSLVGAAGKIEGTGEGVVIIQSILSLAEKDCLTDPHAYFNLLYGAANMAGRYLGGSTAATLAVASKLTSAIQGYITQKHQDSQNIDKDLQQIERACLMKGLSKVNFDATCLAKKVIMPEAKFSEELKTFLPALEASLNPKGSCVLGEADLAFSDQAACITHPKEVLGFFQENFPKIYLKALAGKNLMPENNCAQVLKLAQDMMPEEADNALKLASLNKMEDELVMGFGVDKLQAVVKYLRAVDQQDLGNAHLLDSIMSKSKNIFNQYFNSTINIGPIHLPGGNGPFKKYFYKLYNNAMNVAPKIVSTGSGNNSTSSTSIVDNSSVLSKKMAIKAIGDLCKFFKCELSGKSNATGDKNDNLLNNEGFARSIRQKCSNKIPYMSLSTVSSVPFAGLSDQNVEKSTSDCPRCKEDDFSEIFNSVK